MKIPPKYQIFPKPVILLEKDEGRLAPLLSCWARLHPVLLDTQEPDIERMIVIEMMGRRRPMILERLVGRLTVVSKARIQQKIRRALR
jgi:hypothetical protein